MLKKLALLIQHFLGSASNNKTIGVSEQSVNTPISQSSETTPETASASSVSLVKLSETEMQIKLLSTLLNGFNSLPSLVSGVITAEQNAVALYGIVKQAIVKVEAQFETVKGSGASKKELVLATVAAAAEALGEVWDNLKEAFSTFIDSVIDLYNTAVSAVKGAVAPAVSAEASPATA